MPRHWWILRQVRVYVGSQAKFAQPARAVLAERCLTRTRRRRVVGGQTVGVGRRSQRAPIPRSPTGSASYLLLSPVQTTESGPMWWFRVCASWLSGADHTEALPTLPHRRPHPRHRARTRMGGAKDAEPVTDADRALVSYALSE
jgi:hypothetical protein